MDNTFVDKMVTPTFQNIKSFNLFNFPLLGVKPIHSKGRALSLFFMEIRRNILELA